MSDIEAMYNQVVVPVKDRDFLRFLWFDDQGNEVHYRMTRHLFGGVWCSSVATYALRRAVTDSVDPSPHVVDTVMKSFYVDDCLKSMTTRNETLKVVHDTKVVLAEAGFRLTKFVTNDAQVLESIPEVDRSKAVEGICPNSQSKALGVKWNISDDTFCFDVKVDSIKDLTRRKMLSIVASLFDPSALSPNHLLLLQEQPCLSLGSFCDVDLYKRRWRCVQHLADEFWRRLREYLPLLQTRGKWLKDSQNVQKGDLVLMKDENTPRGVWPLGVVQETFPSSDGLVRSVRIKTKASLLVRPISKLVLLEGSPE